MSTDRRILTPPQAAAEIREAHRSALALRDRISPRGTPTVAASANPVQGDPAPAGQSGTSAAGSEGRAISACLRELGGHAVLREPEERAATPPPPERKVIPFPAPALPIAIDPKRLARATTLRATRLGAGRYLVEGGANPHHVDVSDPARPVCRCEDRAKFPCAHVLAALICEGEPTVRSAAEALVAEVCR